MTSNDVPAPAPVPPAGVGVCWGAGRGRRLRLRRLSLLRRLLRNVRRWLRPSTRLLRVARCAHPFRTQYLTGLRGPPAKRLPTTASALTRNRPLPNRRSPRSPGRPATSSQPPGRQTGSQPPSPKPFATGTRGRARSAGSATPAEQGDAAADDGVFKVRLANFEGPFDLLLQLISKHKLDVTEVALSKVTDEFMAHIRAMGSDWDLDETTEFLVVAATLLDLKAARLLPAAEVEDEADLALLEARDLLFARLLQYRAYKQIADIFRRAAGRRGPPLPPYRRAGTAPRRAAARGRHQHRAPRASPSSR